MLLEVTAGEMIPVLVEMESEQFGLVDVSDDDGNYWTVPIDNLEPLSQV
jgi:hypothetical protein